MTWRIVVFYIDILLQQALQYNVPGGKKNRGLVTVMAYKILVDQDQMTPENLRKVQYLGWCVEMVSGLIYYTLAQSVYSQKSIVRN